MGIDFSSFDEPGTGDGEARHPRDLFTALPREAPYEYLRGPQDQILDQWHGRRDERDLVVKLNTGGGKTVVGLIIAQSSLEDGSGPVAYLVPDRYLAEQVRDEAAALGIPVASDPQDYRYQSREAILVDTFQRLVNGRSVFGVGGSVSKAARYPLGTVVVDDAHACLAKAEDDFKLSVPVDNPVYDALLSLFDDVLEQQSSNALLDLRGKRRSALVPVPYWAWQDRRAEVIRLIHPLTDKDPYNFAWPLIADVLPLCRAVFTSDALEIAPEHLPVEVLTGFFDAKRRVYLTATLADDGVLVKDFDANPKTIAEPVAPANAGDIGDRLILIPQEIVPDATESDVRDLVAGLAQNRNVVVIVPSNFRAEAWKPYGATILDKTNIKQGVEELRSGKFVGLTVLINRYDGVDLPGDACHVLVIDGLPEALGGVDRLDEAQLSGSDALLRRQVQRIEQGMGRAVRSNDDYCVVFLMGARMTDRLLRSGADPAMSPATREQMALSRKVAGVIRGAGGMNQFLEVVNQVLGRDRGWIATSRKRLSSLRYEQAPVDPVTISRRQAFDLAVRDRWTEAIAAAQAALDATGTDRVARGQLLQEIASYQHRLDPAKAQETQRAANESNRSLLRPATGVDYARLTTPIHEQGATASSWLQERYPTGPLLRIGLNALLADLVWGKRTKAFEAAMDDLAWHLGFAGQRPEVEIGRGPDNLWALTDGSFLVIEDKSGAAEHPVYKDDAKQLSNAMDWFRGQYPNANGTPVLVHPWKTFDVKAAIPSGCRVITTEKLFQLRSAMEQVGTALSESDAYRNPTRVSQLLAYHGLTAQHFVERFTEKARTGQ